MAKRILVIDGNDQGRLFLKVEAGTMTVGGDPANVEAVLRDLHITRIYCEVEVDKGLVVVGPAEGGLDASAGGRSSRQELHPGQTLHLGHSRLSLGGGGAGESAETPLAAAPPARPIRRLLVIDGADRGRSFTLPARGVLTIGRDRKYSNIVLHDLYVGRAHCQLRLEEEQVVVSHLEGDHGTLINGRRISRQNLRMGEVLRIGNEYLRLEMAAPGDGSAGEGNSESEGISAAAKAGNATDPEAEVEMEVIEEEDGVVDAIEQEVAAGSGAAGETAAANGAGPSSQPHPPVDQLLRLEDQVLGHYQIGSLIGRGQSGLLFRAVDCRNQQTIALKVLSPDFPADDAELQRFIRALKALPQLQHSHLVTLCGAGKAGPYCWIAREYIEGESAARLIQRVAEGGKFDWTRACRIAVHLGKALDYLHQNRVTHGNLTPRNILIRGEDRATKLADLMLNRALEGSRLQKAILGKKLLAELPYLPPTQTDPHAPGTPLADLYALGVILYALLVGQPPFVAASPREVRAQIREGKLVKPSKYQPGIPAVFEAAVLKLLARRPEDRFPSAAEMLAVVEPIALEHGIKL